MVLIYEIESRRKKRYKSRKRNLGISYFRRKKRENSTHTANTEMESKTPFVRFLARRQPPKPKITPNQINNQLACFYLKTKEQLLAPWRKDSAIQGGERKKNEHFLIYK